MPIDSELERGIEDLAKAGQHDEAIEAAIRGYGPEWFGFLNGVLHDEFAAEEVYAAFLLKLHRGLASFDWACSLRTWSYRVLRNARIDWFRGIRPPAETLSRYAPLAESARLASAIDAARGRSPLVRLRATLDPEDQEILIRHVEYGDTFQEIAVATLGEGATAEGREKEAARLRARFKRAKEKLRRLAEAEGLLEGGMNRG